MSFEIDRQEWAEFRNGIVDRVKNHPNYPYVLEDITIKLGDDIHQVYRVGYVYHHTMDNLDSVTYSYV